MSEKESEQVDVGSMVQYWPTNQAPVAAIVTEVNQHDPSFVNLSILRRQAATWTPLNFEVSHFRSAWAMDPDHREVVRLNGTWRHIGETGE